MIREKDYELNDYELLYMSSENNGEANELIYKKYAPVIDNYARKYLNLVIGKGIDYNDLYQEGLIGLDSAIKSFYEQKDIKFSSFAFLCIERKIITLVKNVNRQKHKILNESYSIDYRYDDDSLPYENQIINDESGIEDLLVSKENRCIFENKVKKELTDTEYQVYILKVNGFSYEEIMKQLNKSYKAISSYLTRIRIKLKKILDEIN